MQVVFAPVSRTASAIVSNTGTRPSSAVWPPLPGVTPATIVVPYSSIAREWNSPSRPVMPWTTRRVSRPTRMLMPVAAVAAATAFAAASSRLRRRGEVGLLEEGGRLRGVRAHDAHDHRHVADLVRAGLDEARGPPRRRG